MNEGRERKGRGSSGRRGKGGNFGEGERERKEVRRSERRYREGVRESKEGEKRGRTKEERRKGKDLVKAKEKKIGFGVGESEGGKEEGEGGH